MLFYLLLKKDGSTILPTADAVHPDFASSSLPSNGESAPQHAAALALTVANLQHKTHQASVSPAAEAAVQTIGHQDVATCLTSAAQVNTPHPAQLPVEPSAVSLQPKLSIQLPIESSAVSLQPAPAACEQGPRLSNSNSGALHPSSPDPGQLSLPAVSASPQFPASSWLPQPLLPEPAPPLPQLQPALPQPQPLLPQLQPVSPQLNPASPLLQPASPHLPPASPQAAAISHTGQPSSQQMNQQLPGKNSQAAAAQDIRKEFLALLQETSTHLAGNQPTWSDQAGSGPVTAEGQPADGMKSEAGTSAVEADRPKVSDAGIEAGQSSVGKAADTASVDRTGSGPRLTCQSDQAGVDIQGTVSHVFHLLNVQEV